MATETPILDIPSKTDFFLISGETVPADYSWDKGAPFTTVFTSTGAYLSGDPQTVFITSETQYMSGYAPGVKVVFFNNSVSDQTFEFVNYEWNFGDYYNDYNNVISLSCVSLAEHVYIMPGKYTVTLKHTQSKTDIITIDSDELLCRGKYQRRWFWDELNCDRDTALTWDEVTCDQPLQKWWTDESACFQKYCKSWTWHDLAQTNANTGRGLSNNPLRWNQTGTDSEFEKKWMFEENDTICAVDDADFLNTSQIVERTVIKPHIIEVVELPPKAGLTCFSVPPTGISPFTVHLSPSAIKPGSFPIDRIDWDFGDGSPIRTISRYTPPLNDTIFLNTGTFPGDPADPRNYDPIYTFVRNSKTASTFYPSLTCYASCTNTFDTCSTIVGPIFYPLKPQLPKLLKSRNTLKGTVYAVNTNNSVSFVTTTDTGARQKIIINNRPTSRLLNSIKDLPISGGYNGDEYPPGIPVDCRLQPFFLPARYLMTEDRFLTPPPPESPNYLPNIAIKTEQDGRAFGFDGEFAFVP